MKIRLTIFSVCALLLVAVIGCASSEGRPTTRSAMPGDPAAVIATAGGESITLSEAEDHVRGALNKLQQDRYETLRTSVDSLVIDRLAEKEAAARGITKEELIRSEIDDKVLDPTPQDVAQMYEQHRGRSGGKSVEQLYEVIYNDLKSRRFLERENAFHNMLKAKYDFAVNFEPPRLEVVVADGAFSRGAADAPITIVEFADFQCAYCKRVHPTLERLLMEYGQDKIRYVFQDFPVTNHLRAKPASRAARCAGEQGQFWQYFEHLMVMRGDLSDTDLVERAEEVGLDAGEFSTCLESERHAEVVDATIANGEKMGITGTPTFFVNGIMMVGAKPYVEFKNVIDEELRRLGVADEPSVDG